MTADRASATQPAEAHQRRPATSYQAIDIDIDTETARHAPASPDRRSRTESSPYEEFAASFMTARRVAPRQATEVEPHHVREPVRAATAATVSGVRGPYRHWLDQLEPLDTAESISRGTASRDVERQTARHPGEDASSLRDVLARRRSGLTPGLTDRPFLVDVLDMMGRPRHQELDDLGRTWQTRLTPSAGGTHCIEPLIHAVAVSGCIPGWYRQEGSNRGGVIRVGMPFTHRLERDLVAACNARPSLVVYAVADPTLIAARYPEGSSLMWRDTGAFLSTVHLLAVAAGFSSTIVGVCTPLSSQTRPPPDTPHVTGAVAVGGRIPTDPMRGSHVGDDV